MEYKLKYLIYKLKYLKLKKINNQSGGSKCKKGEILRKGYTTKNNKKVKPSCVKDMGKKGKGPKILPEMKESGLLGPFGYELKYDFEIRKEAIKKAIKKHGSLKILKYLVLIRTYSKSNIKNFNRYSKDIKFIQKLREDDKYKNLDLYSDNNPETTIKGLGFKNKDKAIYTINKIKKFDLTYQKNVVVTMYFRAKHHPNKTKDMKEAMKIFEKWMKKHKINY